MTNTDLLIIGSGPGGYRAAEYAARHGLNVTIVEEKYAGGTCLNCGCIPTKAFCHDAESLLTAREELGLADIKPDFGKIRERKKAVVEQLRSGVEQLLAMPGITFLRGKASFVDSRTVRVESDEQKGESESIQASNVIIATGSSAKMPPVEGIDSPCVVTSTELLDTDHVPERLCIVGAGVIGMEFASIFSSFGSKVTVIEFLKECLPALDSDIAKRLRKRMEKRGVEFFMQSGVKKIDGNVVTFERKGKELSIEADIVLVATGRKPNIEGLNLEAAGVEYGRGGIVVDDNMQTCVPGIYAIGDVNGRQMLAHAATYQGFRAVNSILNVKDNICFDVMPAAIFTNPEAGCVGLSEDQCEEKGMEYTCHKGYYRSNGKALAMNATEGMVKLLTDSNDVIIGCHIYGSHAADLTQEVAALMNRNATLQQLRETIHIHPTLSEILAEL